MGNLSWLYVGLLVVIGSVHVAHGVLDSVPQNTVAMVGDTITLNCVASDSPPPRVLWTEFTTNALGSVVSDNRNLLPSHPNAARYTITGSGFEYSLEIQNVTLADGGRYLCGDVNSSPPLQHQGFAELVVLASDPECTAIESETGVVLEDFYYAIECEVRYKGFFPPNMTWTGPGTFSNDNSVTSSDAWSRISFIAYRDIEGGQFICRTIFVAPANPMPPDTATNVPEYEHVHRDIVFIVNWGPKEMSIYPRKEFYEVGDVITCEADAKPPPRFVWSNLRTQDYEEPGETYTIPPELLGTEQIMRCNAHTMIEGGLYTADSFVNVSVPAATTPTTTPTTLPTTPPSADAPCKDLTGLWQSTNPNARLCLEVDTKGNILALIQNGTDLYFVTGSGKTVYNDYRHVGFTGIWPPGNTFGVGAFSGECHNCLGVEILLMSGLSRNKANSTQCGVSAGTRLTNIYAFTRTGPPCRGPTTDVYRPTEAHIKRMGIRQEHIKIDMEL